MMVRDMLRYWSNPEAAMRNDFTTYVRLERAIVACTMSDELELLCARQDRLARKWARRRSSRRHWLYLMAAYRRAQDQARWGRERPFYRNGERDDDMASHQRSLNQAAELTAAERSRTDMAGRDVIEERGTVDTTR